jgi:hypothetical protein
MKSYRTRPATRLLVFKAAASVLVFMLAAPLAAQRNNPLRGTPEAARAREIGMREEELVRTRIEMEASRPSEDPRHLAAHKILLEQIKKDFLRIQVIKNEMMYAISINKAFDYKRISDTAAEIKKLANRLKVNLALSKAEDSEKNRSSQNAPDSAELKASLQQLDHTIQSFVTNPLFQKPIIDIPLATKASHDLESIIEISGSIKKRAERLSKIHE